MAMILTAIDLVVRDNEQVVLKPCKSAYPALVTEGGRSGAASRSIPTLALMFLL
jgi:hypothetical protein